MYEIIVHYFFNFYISYPLLKFLLLCLPLKELVKMQKSKPKTQLFACHSIFILQVFLLCWTKGEIVNHTACTWLKWRNRSIMEHELSQTYKNYLYVFKPVNIKYLGQIYTWSYHGHKRILSSILSYEWVHEYLQWLRVDWSFKCT